MCVSTSWPKNEDQKVEPSQSIGNLGDDNLRGEGHEGQYGAGGKPGLSPT